MNGSSKQLWKWHGFTGPIKSDGLAFGAEHGFSVPHRARSRAVLAAEVSSLAGF
jgi:hypothetical protein